MADDLANIILLRRPSDDGGSRRLIIHEDNHIRGGEHIPVCPESSPNGICLSRIDLRLPIQPIRHYPRRDMYRPSQWPALVWRKGPTLRAALHQYPLRR